MFGKVSMLTAIVLVFAASNLQAVEIIDSNWVGCEDGMWGDANNWNPAIVPDNNGTNTFVVTIDTRSCPSEVYVGLQQSRTIDQVDCYGEVELAIWPHDWQNEPVELTIYNGLINHGPGESDIADLRLIVDVTNIGGATLEMTNVAIEGDLNNLIGAELQVEDGPVNTDGGDIQNAGTIILGSWLWADRRFSNHGHIKLCAGGCGGALFDNKTGGFIEGHGDIVAESDTYEDILNKGTIRASFGGPLVVFCKSMINTGTLQNNALANLCICSLEDMNNNGTIEVNAGGGVSVDHNLVNDSNATIQLLGGILTAPMITQSADANFIGFGGITGDVVIESNAIIKLTGPTNVVGDVEIGTGATLEISDGTTLITGHTTCNNGTIHMIGGRVICQGGLTNNNCNIIWEPGTYTNMADFNLDGTVNFKDFADFANTWLWQASWY